MRLKRLDRPHGFWPGVLFRLIRLVQGREAPDVVKTLYYRPEFWGAPFSTLLNDAMRGPSEWSPGERELLAAYTSRLNQCLF